MRQDELDSHGRVAVLIDELRLLSLSDIRRASRHERDEFERVSKGILQTIREENAHDLKAMIAAK